MRECASASVCRRPRCYQGGWTSMKLGLNRSASEGNSLRCLRLKPVSVAPYDSRPIGLEQATCASARQQRRDARGIQLIQLQPAQPGQPGLSKCSKRRSWRGFAAPGKAVAGGTSGRSSTQLYGSLQIGLCPIMPLSAPLPTPLPEPRLTSGRSVKAQKRASMMTSIKVSTYLWGEPSFRPDAHIPGIPGPITPQDTAGRK